MDRTVLRTEVEDRFRGAVPVRISREQLARGIPSADVAPPRFEWDDLAPLGARNERVVGRAGRKTLPCMDNLLGKRLRLQLSAAAAPADRKRCGESRELS